MKKLLATLLALTMILSLCACGGPETASVGGENVQESENDEKIKIGVSIWSSTDVLGSQSKQMLDYAAKALGDVQLMYVDQGHVSEKVTASVETLCAAGCKGIIVCNSADSEMTSCINTCNENHVYLEQFYRTINKKNSPQVYEQAQKSPYYIGAVHEDEVVNGYNLAKILMDKGKRYICLEAWTPVTSRPLMIGTKNIQMIK